MKPIQLAVQVTTILGVASSLLFMSAGCAGTKQASARVRRAPISGPITLPAKPLPVELDPQKTAVIVVDMQNDFGAKGGLLDRAGTDITQIQKAVAPIAKTLTSARRLEIPIIYLKMAFRPDLSDMGAKGSPNWILSDGGGVGKKILAPNGVESRILIRDTWNTDILDELKPATGDVVLYKNRFSGFYQTELDAILKRKGFGISSSPGARRAYAWSRRFGTRCFGTTRPSCSPIAPPSRSGMVCREVITTPPFFSSKRCLVPYRVRMSSSRLSRRIQDVDDEASTLQDKSRAEQCRWSQ
jgi:nicotinamidase-related amidase